MANQIKLNEEQLRNMIMQAINEEMDELNGYFPNLVKRGVNKVINKGKELYNNYQADKEAFNATTAKEKDAMVQAKAGMQQAKTGVRDAKRVNRDIQGNFQKDYQNLTDMQNRYKQIDDTITYEIGQIKRRIGQLSKQAQTNYTTAQDTSAKAKEAYGSSKSAYRTAKQNATNTYGIPQVQPQPTNESINMAILSVLNELKQSYGENYYESPEPGYYICCETDYNYGGVNTWIGDENDATEARMCSEGWAYGPFETPEEAKQYLKTHQDEMFRDDQDMFI